MLYGGIMRQYIGTMVYEHENYIKDCERKEYYKKSIISHIQNIKCFVLKKRRLMKLADRLCDLTFLLEESVQRELMLNEEIWSSDCLEYNVNKVYEYIIKNEIESECVSPIELYEYCNVENDLDIKFVNMNESLRKSKENNPIIILKNDIFAKPFIINGNHRIRNAYNARVEKIKVYIINSDEVVNCLTSEDYKIAYDIYKKLATLIELKLNC